MEEGIVPSSGGAPGFREDLVGSPARGTRTLCKCFHMPIPVGLARLHMTGQCLSACTLRQPAGPSVEVFRHGTCLEVLPLLRSALDHTCNHKPRFVANPGGKEADARGLLRFLPVHRVYSANGSCNSRSMHPRCPLTAASGISVSLGGHSHCLKRGAQFNGDAG